MTAIDAALRELVCEAVREVVRAEVLPRLQAMPQGRGDPSRYLNTDQAAEVAGVKPDTIRDWLKSGRLAGHHAGRHLRVRLDQLEAFLAAGTPAPGSKQEAFGAQVAALVAKGKRPAGLGA